MERNVHSMLCFKHVPVYSNKGELVVQLIGCRHAIVGGSFVSTFYITLLYRRIFFLEERCGCTPVETLGLLVIWHLLVAHQYHVSFFVFLLLNFLYSTSFFVRFVRVVIFLLYYNFSFRFSQYLNIIIQCCVNYF